MTHPLVDLQSVLKPLTKVQLNIFKEGELDEKVVVRKFRITTQHGAMAGKKQSKEVKFYNLDVIISVGYRVKSIQGTRFRQWATERLLKLKKLSLPAVVREVKRQ